MLAAVVQGVGMAMRLATIQAVRVTAMLGAGLVAGPAIAQAPQPPAAASPSTQDRVIDAGKKAGEIASQPVRDLNIDRKDMPPILVRAAEDPYSLAGLATCPELGAEMARLSEVLGPDFKTAETEPENRGEKIAEAGGKAVVNSLIPFRGLVREVTGAAPAQRQLNAAIDAGFARRGFLRGVHRSRGCRPAL